MVQHQILHPDVIVVKIEYYGGGAGAERIIHEVVRIVHPACRKTDREGVGKVPIGRIVILVFESYLDIPDPVVGPVLNGLKPEPGDIDGSVAVYVKPVSQQVLNVLRRKGRYRYRSETPDGYKRRLPPGGVRRSPEQGVFPDGGISRVETRPYFIARPPIRYFCPDSQFVRDPIQNISIQNVEVVFKGNDAGSDIRGSRRKTKSGFEKTQVRENAAVQRRVEILSRIDNIPVIVEFLFDGDIIFILKVDTPDSFGKNFRVASMRLISNVNQEQKYEAARYCCSFFHVLLLYGTKFQIFMPQKNFHKKANKKNKETIGEKVPVSGIEGSPG